MDFTISEDKIKEIAKRYGFRCEKVDNPEKAGFYIDGKQVSADELFGIFLSYEVNQEGDKNEQ